jgi:hypothetical protein
MSLVSATGRYLSSGSDFLTVAVSPFSGVQSDVEAHAVDLGFIDIRISDSRDMEEDCSLKSILFKNNPGNTIVERFFWGRLD